jgi:hypothetical protein
MRGLERREMLRFRANASERNAFQQAADIAGLSLSAWARMVMREAATAALARAGQSPPFTKGREATVVNRQSSPRKSAFSPEVSR